MLWYFDMAGKTDWFNSIWYDNVLEWAEKQPGHQVFYNVVSASCMTKFYPGSCELTCTVICTGPGMIPAPKMIHSLGIIP